MHTTGNVGMIKVKGQHFDVEMSSYNVRGDTGHLARPFNQQSAQSALDHYLPIADRVFTGTTECSYRLLTSHF